MDWRLIGLSLALVAGLADVLGGGLIAGRLRLSGRSLIYLLGLGGGFMLAAALLGRLPEAMEATPAAPLLVVTGYLVIFACENLFSTHAHEHDHALEPAVTDEHKEHGHALVGDLCCEPDAPISNAASLAALAGLLIHTFFDGVAIAAGFELRESVGILMFLAVLLHKIPEGLSLSTIDRRRAGQALRLRLGVGHRRQHGPGRPDHHRPGRAGTVHCPRCPGPGHGHAPVYRRQ